MSLLFLEGFRDGYTGIPLFFSESEVVGIDQVFYLLFDGACVGGNVFFGEEEFVFIVVDFIVADGAHLWRLGFFSCQETSELLLLSRKKDTYFLRRF